MVVGWYFDDVFPIISQVYDFSAFFFAGGFYTGIAMKTAYFGIFGLGFRFP
jgi:hypothetical protein